MISRIWSTINTFKYPDTLVEKVQSLVHAVEKKDEALAVAHAILTMVGVTLSEAKKALKIYDKMV